MSSTRKRCLPPKKPHAPPRRSCLPSPTTPTAATAVAAAAKLSGLALRSRLVPFYSVIFLVPVVCTGRRVCDECAHARGANILPSQLIDGFEAHLNAKKYQEAYELAKNDESFLGKVLSAGLARISSGYPQAIEAMQEVGEEENMRLEHRLSYLALIGTISPMFGLLGTVDGMVQAFDVIAHSTVSPKPSELAQGITTALVTTLVGLWLAIPGHRAFNILRNRISRLVLEVGIVSENLMSRFQNVGGQKRRSAEP